MPNLSLSLSILSSLMLAKPVSLRYNIIITGDTL